MLTTADKSLVHLDIAQAESAMDCFKTHLNYIVRSLCYLGFVGHIPGFFCFLICVGGCLLLEDLFLLLV